MKTEFENLYNKHQSMVNILLYRYGVKNQESREDIAQEIWITIWDSLEKKKLKKENNILGYLHQVVKAKAIDYHRVGRSVWAGNTKKQPLCINVGMLDKDLTNGEVEKVIDVLILEEKLLEEIDKLLSKTKAILMRLRVYGFSYMEIVKISGINLNTVGVHIFQAKKIMRKKSHMHEEVKERC